MYASVKKFLLTVALGLGLAVASQAVLAAEPTVDQVYQAANAGRYIEAQTMLDEVIKAHPDKPKPLFVQAQLYAKQGFLNKAADALAAADKLDPTGKYAKPEALQELRARIAAPRAGLSDNRTPQAQSGGSVATLPPQPVLRQAPPVPERRFPWGLLLGGLGLVAFIIWVTRMMAQRNSAMQAAQPMNNGGGMFGGPVQSYPGGAYGPNGGAGYPPPGYGPGYGAPQAPGMGSRIMGGLATGAAVGAGIVAGEAIARQFTHDDSRNANAAPAGNFDNSNNWGPSPSNYDMGGNDFGVADSSSWDSGGGGGGDSGGSWD